MHYPRLLGLATGLVLTLSAHSTEPLLGAESVLHRIANASATHTSSAPNELAVFKSALADYRAASATLTPEAAATGWLALFDRLSRVPAEQIYAQSYQDRADIGALFQALPPPSDWDALADALETRAARATSPRELGLSALAAVLRGDVAAQESAVLRLRTALQSDKKLESYELQSLLEGVDGFAAAIASSSGEAARLSALANQLDQLEKPGGQANGGMPWFEVPDLASFAPREQIDPLLRRVLRLDLKLQLWNVSQATRRALSEVALQHIDELKNPQWALVAGLEDVALYEALAKRFPAASSNDDDKRQATVTYLLGLVAAERTADAIALLFSPDTRLGSRGLGYGATDVLSRLQQSGRGNAVVDFLRAALERDPTLPLWAEFIALAARQGHAGDSLALLKHSLEQPDLPASDSRALREHLTGALLAADETEEGARLLRELVAEHRAAASIAPAVAAPPPSDAFASFAFGLLEAMAGAPEATPASERAGSGAQAVQRLLKLGRALERPEWIAEAIDAGRAILPRLSDQEAYQRAGLVSDLADHLQADGRLAEAEQLLADHVAWSLRLSTNRYAASPRDGLVAIAALYSRAGRHADVLRVFEQSPDWNARDLAELSPSANAKTPSAHLLLAEALIALGRDEDAVPILRRLLLAWPGHDPAYALLEKLKLPDYSALLQRITAMDRFEERPLIWRARSLLAAGDLAEAERVIRAAIAINPSDGEQGKGDRLRAYAVLGDILERRGDAIQAGLMRDAVAAIRLSEKADDLWDAGLLARAVRLYEESLGRFADAYCIQSRLALRHSETGDHAKAEEHYRRAFELMPESFGRVESHCFGCEGTFNDARAQNVAEKVFLRLAATDRPRAQVYYLLGYLRAEQERPAEAADYFRQAVALDPDYLNAWAKWQDAAAALHLPATERETIALANLRLDPAGRHARPEMKGISDLRRLWSALLEIEANRPPPESGPLFPLTASRLRLEQKADADDPQGMHSFEEAFTPRDNPRERLSETPLLASLGRFLQTAMMR